MRRPVSRYDMLLRLLGALTKALFISMFICTVLAVLAALFGAAAPAYWIYQWIWAFFLEGWCAYSGYDCGCNDA